MSFRIAMYLSVTATLLVFAVRAAEDLNANAAPSSAPAAVCPGDFDGNGAVNLADFLAFAGAFGAMEGDANYSALMDLDGSGVVDLSDFLAFAAVFGTSCPVPTPSQVSIPDVNLRAVIEHSLEQASGAVITPAEMAGLRSLRATDKQISNLTGLEFATGLEQLWLAGNNISDISALSGLTGLEQLSLAVNNISDVSALSGLTGLEELWLAVNNISDVSALSGLANLTQMDLKANNIVDVSALSGLTSLERLWASGNNISDISALSGITSLKFLSLHHNKISDISPLSGLTNLAVLNLRLNRVTDVSPLRDLTNLTRLDLRWNFLDDRSLNDHIPALQRHGVMVFFTEFHKGEFDIELVFTDAFSDDHKYALQLAALRWMSVIVEDIPDQVFREGHTGNCLGHTYEIGAGERIDDLRIYMTPIDVDVWGVNGVGSPHLYREGTQLPVLGCMGFDLEANLENIGLHEIGHVLGFGTAWSRHGLVQDLSFADPDADTHFNGPLAIAAFDDAGGWGYTGRKVPVQKMDGAHWRTDVFVSNEIMLPWGGPALSAVTVQSMADLGYGVDAARADPYTLTGATAGAKIAEIPSSLSLPGLDFTSADDNVRRNVDQDVHGDTPEALATIAGYGSWRKRMTHAEAVWGRGVDFGNGGAMGRLPPPGGAEPELTCGAGLERGPVYVVDPQGRVVGTIGR